MWYARPQPVEDDAVPHRDSIGGYPFLPPGMAWPVCPSSGKPMVFFFQLDLLAEYQLGLPADAHLSVFMSPATNEIPSFDFLPSGTSLAERFWEKREPHFKVYLHRGKLLANPTRDPYLQHQRLLLEPAASRGAAGIYLGGQPDWLQDPDVHLSPDGQAMHFIGQISENFGFAKRPEAPTQPDTFSREHYCLFLGNEIYLFAAAAIDHPEAVWVSVQN